MPQVVNISSKNRGTTAKAIHVLVFSLSPGQRVSCVGYAGKLSLLT